MPTRACRKGPPNNGLHQTSSRTGGASSTRGESATLAEVNACDQMGRTLRCEARLLAAETEAVRETERRTR
jgi:hypothetical protein